MPIIRDASKIPNVDQSWSRLQHSVNHAVPQAIRNTSRSILKIRHMRRGR